MKLTLEVGGVPVEAFSATANFVTDGIKLDFRHQWSLQATIAGETLIPNFTIECSNNGIDFEQYNPATTAVNIPALSYDSQFNPQWFRVSFDANGNTTGTVTFDFNLK